MTGLRRLVAVVVLVSATLGVAAPGDAAARSHACSSADLRYAFVTDAPAVFGVHRLRIEGARCATARRVAKAWMAKYEAGVESGRSVPPRSVAGFTFQTLRPAAAQTYRERGRKGTVTIRFDYLVPNG